MADWVDAILASMPPEFSEPPEEDSPWGSANRVSCGECEYCAGTGIPFGGSLGPREEPT